MSTPSWFQNGLMSHQGVIDVRDVEEHALVGLVLVLALGVHKDKFVSDGQQVDAGTAVGGAFLQFVDWPAERFEVAAIAAVRVKVGAHLDDGSEAGPLAGAGHFQEVFDDQGVGGREVGGMAGEVEAVRHWATRVNNTINSATIST
jgi:hypothetical protein